MSAGPSLNTCPTGRSQRFAPLGLPPRVNPFQTQGLGQRSGKFRMNRFWEQPMPGNLSNLRNDSFQEVDQSNASFPLRAGATCGSNGSSSSKSSIMLSFVATRYTHVPLDSRRPRSDTEPPSARTSTIVSVLPESNKGNEVGSAVTMRPPARLRNRFSSNVLPQHVAMLDQADSPPSVAPRRHVG